MSDDRIRDDQAPGTPGAPQAPASGTTTAGADLPPEIESWPTRPVPARAEALPAEGAPRGGPAGHPAHRTVIRPRPLPPTWMDLPPDEVERLVRQVERAFSSEPFVVPAPQGGRRGEGTVAGARLEAAGPMEAAAAEAGGAPGPTPAAELAAASERRRRRGSRGRGRRRRREGEATVAPVVGLEATGDAEASFADAEAVGETAPAGVIAEAGAAEEEAPAETGAAEQAAPSPEAGAATDLRRRRQRRGRDREERRPPREAAVEGEEREHEAELRALEEALRAGQPRSAADIGAFDEREQALLKDAWPDAPVREGQGPMRRRSQHGLSMEETFEARRERMAEERRARKGTLYVVATPIGNVEDITYRAVRVLKEVRLVAAEDVRQATKLLGHYQIRTPVAPFAEHGDQLKLEPILRRLDEGQAIALVADAGTPGISGPGYALVKAAVERGANVVAVPGACAAVAAVSASGLPTDAWAFIGYLPPKDRKRREALEALKLDRRTLVFYETPGRAYDTIQELCDVLGNRDVVVFREMTRAHEEVIRGKFSKVLAEYRGQEIKGEVVIVVSGWQGKIADREGLSIVERLRLYKQESGLPLADVVRLVARETGTPKSEVYRESLKLVGVEPDRLRPPREEGAAPAEAPPSEAPRPGRARILAEAIEAAEEAPVEAAAAEGPPPAVQAGVTAEAANGAAVTDTLPDTAAAAEPDLLAEPDARDRMIEDARPDAPDVPEGPAPTEPAFPDLAGVEVVEGRPGPGPEVPVAPKE